MARKPKAFKQVETLTHEDATRPNIPTAEYQSVMKRDEQDPVRVAYERLEVQPDFFAYSRVLSSEAG